MSKNDDLLIITAYGKDRPGLVKKITSILGSKSVNIVDIEAKIMRGLFIIFLIIDLSTSSISKSDLINEYKKLSNEADLFINIDPYEEGDRKVKIEKDLMYLTILGKDKPGIVYKLSNLMAEHNANIESIKMIARGEIIVMEILLDISELKIEPLKFRNHLQNLWNELGVSGIFQKEDIYHKSKKLIVFDMDSTLIQAEAIDELAKIAGVGSKVKELTVKAMKGEIDYKQALKERVGLLKGLKESIVRKLAKNMVLTPGSEELIQILKILNYKIAIISGGFSLFTDALKRKLGVDYTFSNKLVIKDGVLTGELEEPIIDAEEKGKIISWLAEVEKISKNEIVAVGDGATDRFMLESSGLGIGFNPKEFLKQFADGVISSDNIFGLLYCLGIPEKELRNLIKKVNKNKEK
ncbi:MAG: phosphoserine phosphatase SerB [Candidatus Helarchaeota archaeon]